MKRLIASYLTAAASASFIFTAVQFNKVTGLNDNWLANRKLVESRIRLNQTNAQSGEFYENAYKSNVEEIGKYSDQYQCASGKDATKCLPAKKR